MGSIRAFLIVFALLCCSGRTPADPPVLLHAAAYESPVRADPDDLLLIPGYGFSTSDRVVYEAMDGPRDMRAHPSSVPNRDTARIGSASVIQVGDPPYSLTVRLPPVVQAGAVYRLWVVSAAGEWSNPVLINDPRPLWITPSYTYSSATQANLERHLRVVGRNLQPDHSDSVAIRLDGPRTYSLRSTSSSPDGALTRYVAEAVLPDHMTTGTYSVRFSRDGLRWTTVQGQKLEIRPDPPPLQRFDVSDPSLGGCHPDDGVDDGPCLTRAIQAAQERGGGEVFLPAGTWDLYPAKVSSANPGDGFVLPRNVHLKGVSPQSSVVIRHDTSSSGTPGALLTLTGHNSVTELTFGEAQTYDSARDARPLIQLGVRLPRNRPVPAGVDPTIEDIVISHDVFRKVGRAIVDSGRPITELYITRNELGAYADALLLTGDRSQVQLPYRIDDSVIRWNRFMPGSYVDVSIGQGTIASQVGASHRMDFSSNTADGTSTEALQTPEDHPGWRAAFFWNANNNHELLLVAENHISCSGDKVGDGEAISLDSNGNTLAFNGAQTVAAAGQDSVTVQGALLAQQSGRPIDISSYYNGHWIQVVAGPGVGQVREIVSYTAAKRGGSVIFRVLPGWDVVPVGGKTRIIVGREYWQAYVVANDIDQRAPPCRKSNLSGPRGGSLSLWGPTADSVVEGNRQNDTDGITFQQAYNVAAPSCPSCAPESAFQTSLDIRGNTIDGEYDWSSDCSNSGIIGSFAAAPTPESLPPMLSFGVSISHNLISRADGIHGGAIDVASTWYRGPPPGDWPLVQNSLIFHNVIRDVTGKVPRAVCHVTQRARTGIRLEGGSNVRDAVLYGNQCDQVDTPLDDAGRRTARVCSQAAPGSCECKQR